VIGVPACTYLAGKQGKQRIAAKFEELVGAKAFDLEHLLK
jgi:hypothetical protein